MKRFIALLLAMTVCISLWACSSNNTTSVETTTAPAVTSTEVTEATTVIESTTQSHETTVTAEETTAPEETEETSADNSELVDGMRPEFKEAMDSYEVFFSDYCEFMKKYQEDPTDLSLLSDYTEFMSQYTETMEEMESWDGDTLNDAELTYYLEVTTRITEMLLEVAE